MLINAVGFTKESTTGAQWAMIGTQFEAIGKTASLDIAKCITMTGVKAVDWDDAMENNATEIQVAFGNVYKHYYYITNATLPDESADVEGWADDDGYLIQDKDLIAIGTCVWLRVPVKAQTGEPLSFTFAGQVLASDSHALPSKGSLQWDMRSNPFPVGLDTAKIDMTGHAAVDWDEAMENRATEIQVPFGNVYKHYYYITNATLPDESADVLGWADDDGYLADGKTIAVPTQGFWLKTADKSENEVIINK